MTAPSIAVLIAALASMAAVTPQAVYTPTPGRAPAAGARTYANALVVAIDAQAGTITVRSGARAKAETFALEAQALTGARALKPGDRVVLTLRAGGTGRPEVVTRIARSVGAPAATSRRTTPAVRITPQPTTTPSPVTVASPRPRRPRPATDTVGPLRDPRVAPHEDPRKDPLRDPRVVPGLSEPAPTPTPTPSPSPLAS